jgi:hypothetical protein
MNNKYKKGALIIIIVLLLIVLPCTVIGIVYHSKNSSIENPNKEFYYDNKLYFYDNNGDLIGKYECMFKNCGYANEVIEDDNYGINYYQSTGNYSNIIDNRYVFIADYKDEQTMVNLYDIKNDTSVSTYKLFKNYSIGIVNNYYIVETITGLYGVIKIDKDSVENVLPFTYEYIALQNDLDLEQNKLSADSFIVKKDNKWYLTDINSAEFTEKMDTPIIAFDATTFITKDEYYSLYNYNGSLRLNGTYTYLNYISKYIEVKDVNNNYYILDSSTLSLVSNLYNLDENSTIDTKINDEDKLEIIIDNESKETIDIS